MAFHCILATHVFISPPVDGHLSCFQFGVSLGPGAAPDTDTLSLLSLRTVASDLQKCDSVEHLRGLSDHTSLDGQELGPRSGGRGGRHQRSISL